MKTWFWILGWILSILAITGNGLIIFLVCSRRQLRTNTNAFVVALAVADLGVGMSVVPSLFFCNLTSSCHGTLPGASPSWVQVIRWLFGFASVTNLCSLVLDRYISVVKPLKYITFMTRRRVIQLISLSWAIPFTLNILPAASLIFSAPLIFYIYSWLVMIFLETCPCFVLVFFLASMVQVVLKHRRAARILAKQLHFNHRVLVQSYEKTTVNIMAIVVGLFLLCYGIYLRCSVIGLFDDAKECNDSEYKIPILVLNSAVNPFVYALLKTDIKKELKRLVCKVIFKKGT